MQYMQIVQTRQIMQIGQILISDALAVWCKWIGQMGLGWISGWVEAQSTLWCYINNNIFSNLHQ